jgi:hypothetical protein
MRFEVSQKRRGGAAHVGSRLTVAKVKTADPANTRTTETSGSRSARKVPDPGIFGSPLLAGRGKWGAPPLSPGGLGGGVKRQPSCADCFSTASTR